MQNVVAAIKELLISGPIRALETGTIRSFHEKHESTRHISKTLGRRGTLISVDINKKSINISKKICKNAENVIWIQKDSVEYLSKHVSGEFDFVLLDSINDAKHIWKEFKLICPRVKPGGVIIVDDAGIRKSGGPDGSPARKGHQVWTKVTEAGGNVSVLSSPHGTQLRIDMTPKNHKIIRKIP